MKIQMPESMKPAFERSSHPFHMWDGITEHTAKPSSVLQDNALTATEIVEQTYDKSDCSSVRMRQFLLFCYRRNLFFSRVLLK